MKFIRTYTHRERDTQTHTTFDAPTYTAPEGVFSRASK